MRLSKDGQFEQRFLQLCVGNRWARETDHTDSLDFEFTQDQPNALNRIGFGNCITVAAEDEVAPPGGWLLCRL